MGNQTSAKVTNLRGNALYHLAVRAYNTAGTGPSSAAVNVTTKKPRECLGGWGGALAWEGSCQRSPLSFSSFLESEGAVRLLFAGFLCREDLPAWVGFFFLEAFPCVK